MPNAPDCSSQMPPYSMKKGKIIIKRCRFILDGETCKTLTRNKTGFCWVHGGRNRKHCRFSVDGKACKSHAEGKTDFCVAHGGGKRCRFSVDGEACGTSAKGKTDFCIAHGGGKRCRFSVDGKACGTSAEGKTDFCIAHGGGKRCRFSVDGEACKTAAHGKTDFCVAHGGGKRCRFSVDGKACKTSAEGKTDFCVAHGGGKRCDEVAAHLGDIPHARYKVQDKRLCWGCFVSLHPDLAKLKVRKEHYVLAEVQRRLGDGLSDAKSVVWDCRVPGGCTLLRPDLLMVFKHMYIQLEVDEFGHDAKSCDDEDARLELIAADVGLPGAVIRLNPDVPGFECFRHVQLRNGESALRAVGKNFELAMDRLEREVRKVLACPPSTLLRIFVDSSPDEASSSGSSSSSCKPSSPWSGTRGRSSSSRTSS